MNVSEDTERESEAWKWHDLLHCGVRTSVVVVATRVHHIHEQVNINVIFLVD